MIGKSQEAGSGRRAGTWLVVRGYDGGVRTTKCGSEAE